MTSPEVPTNVTSPEVPTNVMSPEVSSDNTGGLYSALPDQCGIFCKDHYIRLEGEGYTKLKDEKSM